MSAPAGRGHVAVKRTSSLNSSRKSAIDGAVPHAAGPVAVEALEELRGAKRWTNLPSDQRGLLCGHLVWRPGRHLERGSLLVEPLLPCDHSPHRALEDLEVLGLARMEVLRRHPGGAAVAGLHLKNLTVGLGASPDEAEPEAVGAFDLLTRMSHGGEATNGPLRSIRWVRRTLQLAFPRRVRRLRLEWPRRNPTACLDPATAYLSALQAAPTRCASGPAPRSADCFGATQEAGELADVGQTVIRVATQLNAEARRDPGGEDTVMLGYLAARCTRATSHAAGADADLVRRFDAAARFSPSGGTLGAAFERAFGKGYAAGEQDG